MELVARHGRVRVCARAGGETCTRQPEEGAPLPCNRVRKAVLHGKAMPARRAGAQRCGEVRRKGKRTKGPAGPLWLGRTRAGVHNCVRAMSLHGCVRERERAGPRRWLGAATHGMAAQGTKNRNKATTRARWSWQRHLQEKASQLG
jgi:hypothetical protein